MKIIKSKIKFDVKHSSSIKAENLEVILNHLSELIANCDAKASAVVAWCGVSISVLLVTDFIDNFIFAATLMIGSGKLWAEMYFLVMSLVMSAFVTSFGLIVLALTTRLYETSAKTMYENSIIDPFNISMKKNAEEYLELIAKTTSEDYKNDLIRQIYITSVSYSKKIERYKTGSEGTIGSLFVLVVMALIAILLTGKV